MILEYFFEDPRFPKTYPEEPSIEEELPIEDVLLNVGKGRLTPGSLTPELLVFASNRLPKESPRYNYLLALFELQTLISTIGCSFFQKNISSDQHKFGIFEELLNTLSTAEKSACSILPETYIAPVLDEETVATYNPPGKILEQLETTKDYEKFVRNFELPPLDDLPNYITAIAHRLIHTACWSQFDRDSSTDSSMDHKVYNLQEAFKEALSVVSKGINCN